uniref:BIG2 domain-containing protein n=1 Tax=viral metagenome TaxID=1070528 RepID=A0A6C0C830_9ZZZZ
MNTEKRSNTTLWIVIAVVVLLVLIGGGVGLWYYMKKDIVISISPLTDTLMQNEQRRFTAIVRDTSGKTINDSVTWKVDSPSARIDDGNFTATGSSGSVIVTATSVEDPSKSASATVTLLPSMPIFLKTNAIITSDDPLYSRNRDYNATMLNNGKICVKSKDNTNKWCSYPEEPPGKFFTRMQEDGNLCTYLEQPAGQPLGASVWCSKSKSDVKDNYAVLNEDGKLCIYKGKGPDDNRGQVWCSG